MAHAFPLVRPDARAQAGQPGRGTAERTYQFILDDRFLQETNTTYPPQDKNKNAEVHHHMSMISYDTSRKLVVFRLVIGFLASASGLFPRFDDVAPGDERHRTARVCHTGWTATTVRSMGA